MRFKYRLEVEHKDGTVFTDPDFALVFRDALDYPDNVKTFSAVGDQNRYTIDLTQLPENTRPIHYAIRSKTFDVDGNLVGETAKHHFGYQYTDQGKSVKAIRELP